MRFFAVASLVVLVAFCGTVQQTSAAEPPTIVAQAAVATAPPPLNLSSLETRLKDTDAIGFMTKLSLRNQVDDLLSQFRAFYAGRVETTMEDLRRGYDLLMLKVLSLLQNKDPELAAALSASRQAIWEILSDRAKFASML
jgi:hypothetical protein